MILPKSVKSIPVQVRYPANGVEDMKVAKLQSYDPVEGARYRLSNGVVMDYEEVRTLAAKPDVYKLVGRKAKQASEIAKRAEGLGIERELLNDVMFMLLDEKWLEWTPDSRWKRT